MPPEIDLLSMESVTSVFFPFGENKQRKDVTRAKYRNAFITHPDESIVPGLIIWMDTYVENGFLCTQDVPITPATRYTPCTGSAFSSWQYQLGLYGTHVFAPMVSAIAGVLFVLLSVQVSAIFSSW